MHIFVNIRAKRAFNLLYKQCFGQIEKKKITELKNTLQTCKLLKKIVRLSPSNVLLKIELGNNDEINTSQITKKNTSVTNLEALM